MHRLILLFVSLYSLSLSLSAAADSEEKTWDLGIGVGLVSVPDYRGSRQYRQHIGPIPYVIYRGPFLRIDREGMRGKFFQHEGLELNLSATATLTPESHRNQLREGMPGIYSTVEIGPAMNVNLTGHTFEEGWHLSLPLRSVISIGDAKPKAIGWIANPQFVYRYQAYDWDITYRTGIYYATRRYHEHYYSVAPEQATEQRPEFAARSGYSGWSNQVALSRRVDNWWYGLYIRHDNLHGTRFVDSPLVETREAVSSGIGLSRIFF